MRAGRCRQTTVGCVRSELIAIETRKECTMADRDMSGSLSKNLRKEKPTHADYVGSIVIEGRKYWLNGWVKDGREGKVPQPIGEGGAGAEAQAEGVELRRRQHTFLRLTSRCRFPSHGAAARAGASLLRGLARLACATIPIRMIAKITFMGFSISQIRLRFGRSQPHEAHFGSSFISRGKT
jgi:hypothetical protein